MDDNICTKAATLAPNTPTAAPSPTGAPAPSAAPQGTFCWTDGQCHDAAEPKNCYVDAYTKDEVVLLGVSPAEGCYCGTVLLTVGQIFKGTLSAGVLSLALDSTLSTTAPEAGVLKEGVAPLVHITGTLAALKAGASTDLIWAAAEQLCVSQDASSAATGFSCGETCGAGNGTAPTLIEFTKIPGINWWKQSGSKKPVASEVLVVTTCNPSIASFQTTRSGSGNTITVSSS